MIDPLDSWDPVRSRATFDDNAKVYETYYQSRFGAHKLWKIGQDLDRYRMAIAQARPEVIIETGTRWGGSAVWFREHCQVPQVITIDVDPSPIAETIHQIPGLTCITADSAADWLAPMIQGHTKGYRTMVVLDSDHHFGHVTLEIERWAPLVTPGSFLVVEDGIFDLLPKDEARRGGEHIPEEGGPLAAISGWVEHGGLDARFTRAVDVEGLSPVSHHPAGWWRRNA